VDAGVLEAPVNPDHLRCRPADPQTDAKRSVTVGNVRVQLLSPTLLRLEEKGSKGFEDRCTFVVVDRDWPGIDHERVKKADGTHIETQTFTVVVPGDGASLVGTKVLNTDGTVLFDFDGKAPGSAFLPGPSDSFASWVMGDMPRFVPPEWGATPPPNGENDSGWDKGNDAPDVYVFVPGDEGYRQLRKDFLKLTGPIELPPLYTFGL